jgi:hypothetical protein
LTNTLSEASAFGVSKATARQTVADIAKQVAYWKTVFQNLGVRDADNDVLAQYLDGEKLMGLCNSSLQEIQGFLGDYLH